MVRTQVQLTEAQMERLRDEARERGVSIAELVREAVDRLPRRNTRADRHRRALEAIGAFASGSTDVSERHDEYLVEGYAD